MKILDKIFKKKERSDLDIAFDAVVVLIPLLRQGKSVFFELVNEEVKIAIYPPREPLDD